MFEIYTQGFNPILRRFFFVSDICCIFEENIYITINFLTFF